MSFVSSKNSTQLSVQNLLKMSKQMCQIKSLLKLSKEKRQKLTSADISEMFKCFSNMPFCAQIQSLRGWCFQIIQKYELAAYIYDQVLLKCPLHAPTLRRKSQLLRKLNKQILSQQLLTAASYLQPDNLYLQILRSDEDDQNQEQQIQNDNEEPENQNEDNNKWMIKIKSIDRPLGKVKHTKSVLFKSQLQSQISQSQLLKQQKSLNPIKTRKSSLKLRSYQNIPKIKDYQPQALPKSFFDVEKIKSIDGKISMTSIQSKKQVLFSIDDHIKLHLPNTTKYVKRKSSLIIKSMESKKSLA